MNQRASEDAHPAPTPPSAGAPSSPKTSIQLNRAFATLPTATVITIGFSYPTAWSIRCSTMNRKNGTNPGIEAST